jgi:hypothetical protein
MGRKPLVMNAFAFGAAARDTAPDQPKPDTPVDAAWIVLEAANDLGDHQTVEICRRVIDANLNGRQPAAADLHVVTEYFR